MIWLESIIVIIFFIILVSCLIDTWHDGYRPSVITMVKIKMKPVVDYIFKIIMGKNFEIHYCMDDGYTAFWYLETLENEQIFVNIFDLLVNPNGLISTLDQHRRDIYARMKNDNHEIHQKLYWEFDRKILKVKRLRNTIIVFVFLFTIFPFLL